MIFEEKYRVGIEDIGEDNLATNRAVFTYLEDIACVHANSVNFGLLNSRRGSAHWILLSWNLHILKRPIYDEILTVRTWLESADRVSCIRDFDILNEKGECLAVASSRWVLMDLETRKIIKLTEEYIADFGMEPDKKALNEPLTRFVEPEAYAFEMPYTVERRDIDLNNHVHNLNYLDIAYEMLPEDVYHHRVFNTIVIEYKKEVKYGDDVKCYYTALEDGKKQVVTFKVSGNMNAAVVLE